MHSLGSIILELIQNVSLFALVVVGYAAIRRRMQLPPRLRDAVIGLVFGGGALLAMSVPVSLAPGIAIDGRSALISTAAIFGGPAAMVITVAMSLAYRLWLGGAGALPASFSIICTGMSGLICYQLIRRKSVTAGPLTFFVLGAAVVSIGLGLFLALRWEVIEQVVSRLVLPLYLVVPCSTMILGVMLQREDVRMALQEKLAQQTRLFEAVFNSMSDGIAVAGPQGQIVLANPIAAELAGLSVDDNDDAGANSMFERFEPDGKTPFPDDKRPLLRALRGIASDNVEIVVRNPLDARKRRLHVNARPVLDAGGRPQGGVAVFRDVTVQRETEEDLRRSETRLKEAIDAMESGFALFDADDRLIICNDGFIDPATRAAFGVPIGRSFEEIFRVFAAGHLTAVEAMGDREGWVKRRLAQHRNPPKEPLEIQWTDGRWMRVTERRTAEGGFVGVWTDITAMKAAEARLRDAIESIQEGFALFDAEMRFVIFNQRFLEMYPLSAPAIAPGASMEDVLRYGAERGEYPALDTPEQIDTFVRDWIGRFRSQDAYYGEGAFSDGRWALVSQHSTSTGGFVGVRADITLLKQREQALQRQQDLLRSITDAMPVMICFIDADLRYRYCNRAYLAYLEAFGWDGDDVLGRRLQDGFSAERYATMAPHIDLALRGQRSSFERPLKGLSNRFVEGRYIPQIGIDGRVDGFYVVVWDITDRREKELRLIEQASTDKLTGLLNRGSFLDLLRDEIHRQSQYGQPVAVMYLDVDRFKQINDNLGHDAGDTVLVKVAERLRANVRNSDFVARFGGDEFVILLVAPRGKSDVEAIADKLVLAVREAIPVNGMDLVVCASIGVAYAERPVPSAEMILKLADAALYAAKQAGRDTYRLRVAE